jgi:hypothetical protein
MPFSTYMQSEIGHAEIEPRHPFGKSASGAPSGHPNDRHDAPRRMAPVFDP